MDLANLGELAKRAQVQDEPATQELLDAESEGNENPLKQQIGGASSSVQNLVHHHRRGSEPQLAAGRRSGKEFPSQSSAIWERSHLWGHGAHKFTQESIPFQTVRGCSDAGPVHVVSCVRQQMVLRVVGVFVF